MFKLGPARKVTPAMSSSLTQPADASPAPDSLLGFAEAIPDPHARRGVRYRASAIIAAGIAAVLAGACTLVAISEWLEDLSDDAAARPGFHRQDPPL